VLDHGAEALLAFLHRLFRALALYELADLAADRRQSGELLLVALPRLAAEELDNPEALLGDHDGECDAPVQAHSRGSRTTHKFGFSRDVHYPDRCCLFPDLSDHPPSRHEGQLASGRVKNSAVEIACAPDGLTSQPAAVSIHNPKSAPIPFLVCANGPEQIRRGQQRKEREAHNGG
jgi:hypothetical protein